MAFPLFALLGAASYGAASVIETKETKPVKSRAEWVPSSKTVLAWSAGSLLAIVPYTLVVMRPCLTMLFERKGEVVKGQDIMDLLNLWATHHVVRVVFTTVGFVGGILSTVL